MYCSSDSESEFEDSEYDEPFDPLLCDTKGEYLTLSERVLRSRKRIEAKMAQEKLKTRLMVEQINFGRPVLKPAPFDEEKPPVNLVHFTAFGCKNSRYTGVLTWDRECDCRRPDLHKKTSKHQLLPPETKKKPLTWSNLFKSEEIIRQETENRQKAAAAQVLKQKRNFSTVKKIKLCGYYQQNKICPDIKNCKDAHSAKELIPRCRFGPKCKYAKNRCKYRH